MFLVVFYSVNPMKTSKPPPPPQADLTAVPTEFESLLEYQRILSQLVMKEAVAAMQKDVGMRRSKPLVMGEVRDSLLCVHD